MHCISYRPTNLSLLNEFSKKSVLKIFIILFEKNCPGQCSMVNPTLGDGQIMPTRFQLAPWIFTTSSGPAKVQDRSRISQSSKIFTAHIPILYYLAVEGDSLHT